METAAECEGRGSGKVEVEEEEAQARSDVEGQTPAESEGRASGEGEGRGSVGGDEGEKREWGIGGGSRGEGIRLRGGLVRIALTVAWEGKTRCC